MSCSALVDLRRILEQPPGLPGQHAILGESADVDEARRGFNRLVDDGDQMMSVNVPERDMMGHRLIGTDLDSGRRRARLGKANAFADQPAKVMATSAEEGARHERADERHGSGRVESRREVVISSPYFVPGTVGVTHSPI